jgi:hypothetical protein
MRRDKGHDIPAATKTMHCIVNWNTVEQTRQHFALQNP